MGQGADERLIAEQIDYYRARAHEYDETELLASLAEYGACRPGVQA